MTKADCLQAARTIMRAHGWRNLDHAKLIVIHRGYKPATDGHSIAQWQAIEHAFHTAQMWAWAAEERGDKRAFWVHAATQRAI